MSPIRSKNYTCIAIGERHLPIESTIASRSTDVMMETNQTTNNNSIRSILDKEKLNGSNFLDWLIMMIIGTEFFLRKRLLSAIKLLGRPLRWEEEGMPNMQKFSLYLSASNQLRQALPEEPPTTATAAVHNAYTHRDVEQQEVACLMLIKAYLDQIDCLGYPMPLVLGVNLILTLLFKDYDRFVQNYNMHDMGKTILELYAMLKLIEKGHKVSPLSQPWTLEEELPSLFGRVEEEQSQHGVRGIQKLNKGALDLYVVNGNRAVVEAIRSFDLILPSGTVLVLDNFHFAPSITRGVISLLRLWDNGFLHKFTDYGAISVSKDNLFYFNAIPRDGIFEIDMHNYVSNECSIYTCSNKKSKHNLDSTFLWRCHLGHINKKRIVKLQHDGLLKSIDDESFDVCVSCISGKMARKPFTHASKRVNDLLGLIHSDVCGPFRTTEDAQPSENTNEHQPEAEHDDVEPQTDVNLIRRSARIPQAPERYGFYVDTEEHELGDHGEPPPIELHCRILNSLNGLKL
ncbi:retrotransposon protein, putative, ty1-copia subclass [Tanacetum coccineum]